MVMSIQVLHEEYKHWRENVRKIMIKSDLKASNVSLKFFYTFPKFVAAFNST